MLFVNTRVDKSATGPSQLRHENVQYAGNIGDYDNLMWNNPFRHVLCTKHLRYKAGAT